MKKKTKKQLDKEIIAEVTKEMAKPRVAASARNGLRRKCSVMTKAFEIGDHNVDVQAMRERWEKSKVYSVAPNRPDCVCAQTTALNNC
jgi:hypothetical protein